MKKQLNVLIALLCCTALHAQVLIQTGSHWIAESSPQIIINNLDLRVNGNYSAGDSKLIFSGNASSNIIGNNILSFAKLGIDKTSNADVILNTSFNLVQSIDFLQGNLELNGYNINMASGALLLNENEQSRIKGAAGGEVIITQNLNAPSTNNPGNLGAVITTSSNLGAVTVRRGHLLKTGIGLSSGIARNYNIVPANNENLDASVQFRYFDAELNSQEESSLGIFKSTDNGTNWSAIGFTNRDALQNYVTKTGLSSLSMFSLSSSAAASLPVTNLQFFAKRLNPQTVQLNWQTEQEFNNNVFHIERKKESETQFVVIGFERSKAISGNSSSRLTYEKTDANNYAGKTYYRLRQEDLDGKYVYSAIRFVNGSNDKLTVLKVWPVPAINNFYVQVQGISKEDVLQLFDMNGRMVKTIIVKDQEQVQIGGLTSGTYIIRLASDKNVSQKVIVQ